MILLTGASGYVGGRLLPTLLARGEKVRCLLRRPQPLPDGAQAAIGDVLDEATLRLAMEGVDAAYYLVHAMAASADFEEVDRRSARLFGRLARDAGVRRIVYLGGLGRGEGLSGHLRSRQEVGRLLGEAGVPVVEFRASVILGAGSVSFELARALVEKLPLMVTPRWVRTPAQPIAIDDVVAYLLEALDVERPGIFEIGGAERVTYGGIMTEIARQKGLRRWMVPVPALTPRLSSLWLSLVAPKHAKVGRRLIEGVRNETTVSDDAAARAFGVRPVGAKEAVARALAGATPAPPPSGSRAAAALASCLLAGLAAAGPGLTPLRAAAGLSMGAAAWRVWRRDGLREERLALGVFGLLLAGFAVGWPAVVLPLAAVTATLFWARDRAAAVLVLIAAAGSLIGG
jgi:uncharacterized protein YbjT (DUF2867 family)